MAREQDNNDIERMLRELHSSYLKGNEYDEGDPIFYRINYRLADAFALTKEEAERHHAEYHRKNPRRVSEGFCDACNRIVGIIPIIYGVQEGDMERMKAAEEQGRLIIGDLSQVREGAKVAMFGCKSCKTPLAKYGSI
ncbi:hypothetical protein [Nitrososphaera viennensis]|uniref:Uncharacterized protein n=2 Tax=Nitrososphaera viennensis TaxID=1034015 RepID=A0A060HLC2_9ARCH|nr:hypothetical protein [Nitrososphaera viennensis]AIC14386.1 hypothetical protein NVIE_002030 [Nitrososphaera viennensis EN76]UVS69369.1 hypothetical protein NWT39_00950 [Nitrososphaera viennensis]